MDTTYRVVCEGHGVLLVGVVGLSSKYHAVAEALVSNEDTAALDFALSKIKEGAESTVSKYRESRSYC